MAKRELTVEKYPEISAGGKFVRYFQGQILILFKSRGKLTETQCGRGLRLLGEERE